MAEMNIGKETLKILKKKLEKQRGFQRKELRHGFSLLHGIYILQDK